jgi:hypothetical protein
MRSHPHPDTTACGPRRQRCGFPAEPRSSASASWRNQVEHFFHLITTNVIRRGVFRSTADQNAAIRLA